MESIWFSIALGLGLYLVITLFQKFIEQYRAFAIGRQIAKQAAEAAKAEIDAFRVGNVAGIPGEFYSEMIHHYMESELYETKLSGPEFYVRHKGSGPWTKIIKVEQKQEWEE